MSIELDNTSFEKEIIETQYVQSNAIIETHKFRASIVKIGAALSALTMIGTMAQANGNNERKNIHEELAAISPSGCTMDQPMFLEVVRHDLKGYWDVARDGTITNSNTPCYGDLKGFKLNEEIVGMYDTPDDQGYWLAAKDGGVFAFGDAQYYGSEGGVRLNKPVTNIAPTPSGKGYWLVASDGGVFSFGDATFHGSTGNINLISPATDMASNPTNTGYWIVAADGGVFSFDVPFYGSDSQPGMAPIDHIVSSSTGRGYEIVGATRGKLFGDFQQNPGY